MLLLKDRLRQLIDERLGGNQTELARSIGEHPNWVNNRVSGLVSIKGDELPKLARGLGVQASAFFEEEVGHVAEVGPHWFLVGWERMRKEDRRLYEEIVEAFDRWRDATLHRRQTA